MKEKKYLITMRFDIKVNAENKVEAIKKAKEYISKDVDEHLQSLYID